MYIETLLIGGALLSQYASACPQHNNHRVSGILNKRQQIGETYYQQPTGQKWQYDAICDWASLDPDYEMCQMGTHQSPIPLTNEQGLAHSHLPTFNYHHNNVTGNFDNWGYGPRFTLEHPDGEYTGLPSFTFTEGINDTGDNETVYLVGWHIHSPSEHTINGEHARSEMHLVHVDKQGHERAVVAIMIDASNDPSPFLEALPPMFGSNETGHQMPTAMNMKLPIQEVNNLAEFWTYKGSLTTPPCHEGLRWFVGRQRLYMSTEQMQDLLHISRYSARPTSRVWQHEVNA